MTDRENRRRGILSPADREYLRGEKDLTRGSERNARQRIRDRIRAGLADFRLLWNLLPDDDLEQVFHPDDEERRQEIRASSHQALTFLLLGLWTSGDPHPGRLEDIVRQAAYANDWLATADVDISVEEIPDGELLPAKLKHKERRIEELKERLRNENLSESKRTELREEVRREADIEYLLFERGLVDPTVDAEAFASVELLGEELELTPEEVERNQETWEDAALARNTLPIIVDKSRTFDEEGDRRQRTDDPEDPDSDPKTETDVRSGSKE